MLFENLNYVFENFQKIFHLFIWTFSKKTKHFIWKISKKTFRIFFWRFSKKSAIFFDRLIFLIPNILKVSSLNCEHLLTRASTLPQNETLHEKMKKIPKIRGFFLWRFFLFRRFGRRHGTRLARPDSEYVRPYVKSWTLTHEWSEAWIPQMRWRTC